MSNDYPKALFIDEEITGAYKLLEGDTYQVTAVDEAEETELLELGCREAVEVGKKSGKTKKDKKK